ncbi:MAG: C45 family autoproteolytic acyltransferase/hydrolase [Candidatus Hodarchaeota archaeon]
MISHEILPVLRVSGTNYEIGFQVGQHFKERIKNTLDNLPGFKVNKVWDNKNPERLKKVKKISEKYFPQYMEELRGYAEGSGIEFNDIFIHNYFHMPRVDDCSTGIFKYENKTLIAHNEDAHPIIGKNAYFLFEKLENGSSFLVYSYPGMLPGVAFGFNSYGIFFCCNSLPDPTKSVGLSRNFLGRNIFEQKSIEDSLLAAQRHTPRSGGVSYNVVSLKANVAVNLETTGNLSYRTDIADRYFHTNHYISEGFGSKNFPIYEGSLSKERLEGGLKLLYNVEKNAEGLLQILSDDSVFVKFQETGNKFQTNGTALVEIIKGKEIDLKFFPPFQEKKKYQHFRLKDLIEF